MAIVIDGTGSITGISAGGLPDGVVTAADLASGAITAAALPAGSVLQVVNATNNTNSSTTTADVELSCVSASITPSKTSSKILIFAKAPVRYLNASTSAAWSSIKIKRNGTLIAPNPGANYEQGISFPGGGYTNDWRMIATIQSLDSPSSTSSLTYSVVVTSYASTVTTQVNESNLYYSSIVLMEIAA